METRERATAVLDVPSALGTGEMAGRQFAFGGLSHLLLPDAKSLATSVRAVVTELKSLEIPDALAILKERNHSVLADSEDASEARGGDSGRSTTAFNVLGVQVRQVRVTENRAEC